MRLVLAIFCFVAVVLAPTPTAGVMPPRSDQSRVCPQDPMTIISETLGAVLPKEWFTVFEMMGILIGTMSCASTALLIPE